MNMRTSALKLRHKIFIATLFCAIVYTPAFAQQTSFKEKRELNRIKVIDAALANTQLNFFEEDTKDVTLFDEDIKASIKINSQEPPVATLERTTFDLTEKVARENVPNADTDKHLFEIDAEKFYFRYREPNVMKETGTMHGIYSHYTYRPLPGDMLYTKMMNLYKIEGRYSFGEVDYEAVDGAKIKNIDDWSAEVRGIFGKEFITWPTATILYSGAGYRYLNDNPSGRLSRVGNTVRYGYQREANYYYLPIGFQFSNRLNDNWSVAINGEYDWFVYGLQRSHTSDGNRFISTRNDDIENQQHRGYGLRGSLKIAWESDIIDLVLEPFARYWNIEDSEVVRAFVDGAFSNFIEPKNNTIETGLKVGLQF